MFPGPAADSRSGTLPRGQGRKESAGRLNAAPTESGFRALSAAGTEVVREELLDAPVEGDPVVGVAEAVALGIGVRLVLDAVFFKRRHRELEVQEGRPDVAVAVLDEDRRGDVSDPGHGLRLVVDLGPFLGESAVAVHGEHLPSRSWCSKVCRWE